jgi:hypothetical protein
VARNHAITDWAEAEMKRVRAAGFSDRPFTVMRTWADPRMGGPDAGADKAIAEHLLRGPAGEGQSVVGRHRRGVHDTDHYFTTPGARSEQADTIARWIAKRWR